MATILERVRGLLRLATDEGSPAEEQRTAAITACRLIHKHDLLRDGSEIKESKKARHRAAKRAQEEEKAEAEAEDYLRNLRADPSAPHCDICKRRIQIGDLIIFRFGFPFVHMTCYDKWRVQGKRGKST